MSRLRDLDRIRSQYASRKVMEIAEDENRGKYRTRARQFPSYVRENKLLQAIVFYYSKTQGRDQTFLKFLEHLIGWFQEAAGRHHMIFSEDTRFANTGEFIMFIQSLDASQYRHARKEALKIGLLLKRFAEALIPDEEEDN